MGDEDSLPICVASTTRRWRNCSCRCIPQRSFGQVYPERPLTHTLGPFCDTSSVAADWFWNLQHEPSSPNVDRLRRGWFGGDFSCQLVFTRSRHITQPPSQSVSTGVLAGQRCLKRVTKSGFQFHLASNHRQAWRSPISATCYGQHTAPPAVLAVNGTQ